MPGVGGRDVLGAVRVGDFGTADIPVLIVSGDDRSDSPMVELRMGAHDYIRKPFEANELLARVGAAVRVAERQRGLQERMAELELLACTDPLTGLPNRRELQRAVRQAESDALCRGENYSIVLIDVDRFKQINDRHGHGRGDEALEAVASVLKRFIRTADTAGRWGGDEFLIVIPRGDERSAVSTATRTREQIAAEDRDGLITVSAGVAVGPTAENESPLDQADRALMAAKSAGRNRVEVARS